MVTSIVSAHSLLGALLASTMLLASASQAAAQEATGGDDELATMEFDEAGAPEDTDTEDAEAEDDEDAMVVTTMATEVDGELDGAPRRVERISSDDLERRGVNDLSEALEWLSAGSSSSPTGNARGLLVDGLPSSQLTVLRDGLPLVRPSGSPNGPIVDLASITIDPSSIERIDIYRGVGPIGSGVSGGVIIDIITRRRQRTPQASVLARWSTAGTSLFRQDYNFSASGPLSKKLEFHANAQYTDARGVDVNADTDPDTPDVARLAGEGVITWHTLPNSYLQLQLIGNDHITTNRGGERAIFDDRIERKTARARLRGRWWLGQDLRLDHSTDFGRNRYDFDKIVRSSAFERDKSLTTHDELNQAASVTWFHKNHDLAAETYLQGYFVDRTGETGELDPVNQYRGSVGFADTWYASEKLELFSRGLADLSSIYGVGAEAYLSAAWAPVETLTWRTEVSTTRRVPTPEELFLEFDHSEVGYRVIGNPDLLPERLYSAATGLVWTSKDKFFGAEARGYTHLLDNVIVNEALPEDPSQFTYANRDRARVFGAQVTTQLRDLPANLQLIGNYNFLPVAIDLDSQERLPQRPYHGARVELRGRYLDGKLEAWTDLNTRSSFEVPAGSDPAPAYAAWGLGASYSPNKQTRVVLDLNNLLDYTNATWGPLPGRSVFLSVRSGFELQP